MKVYDKYAELYFKYGVKLSLPVTHGILSKLTTQSEVFDVIWGVQAPTKEKLPPAELSKKVMAEISRLASMLLSHQSFIDYKGDEYKLIKRANRHYSSAEDQTGFNERQDTIREKLHLS